CCRPSRQKNPRPTRCGTPSRRFRDYDSEPRRWFPKIPVTEAGAAAKLKFAEQIINRIRSVKRRQKPPPALRIAHRPAVSRLAIAGRRRLLAPRAPCAAGAVRIASADIIHIFAGTRALPEAISGGFGKRTRS